MNPTPASSSVIALIPARGGSKGIPARTSERSAASRCSRGPSNRRGRHRTSHGSLSPRIQPRSPPWRGSSRRKSSPGRRKSAATPPVPSPVWCMLWIISKRRRIWSQTWWFFSRPLHLYVKPMIFRKQSKPWSASRPMLCSEGAAAALRRGNEVGGGEQTD